MSKEKLLLAFFAELLWFCGSSAIIAEIVCRLFVAGHFGHASSATVAFFTYGVVVLVGFVIPAPIFARLATKRFFDEKKEEHPPHQPLM